MHIKPTRETEATTEGPLDSAARIAIAVWFACTAIHAIIGLAL